MASFGENLKRIREAKDLTQDELARRMGYTNNSQIAAWERDPRRLPDVTNIRRAAGALDVEPWELLDGVETDIDRLRRERRQMQDLSEQFWSERRDRTKGLEETEIGRAESTHTNASESVPASMPDESAQVLLQAADTEDVHGPETEDAGTATASSEQSGNRDVRRDGLPTAQEQLDELRRQLQTTIERVEALADAVLPGRGATQSSRKKKSAAAARRPSIPGRGAKRR